MENVFQKHSKLNILLSAEAFSPSGGPGGATSLVEITNGRVQFIVFLCLQETL